MTTISTSFIERLLELLWVLALGGSALLLAAALVTRVMRRAAASTRFMVWTCAMAGVLALAIGRLFLPPISVPTSSAWLLALHPPTHAAGAQQEGSVEAEGDRRNAIAGRAPPSEPSISAQDEPSSQAAASTLSGERVISKPLSPLVSVLLSAWALGALALLVRFATGTLSVRRAVHRSPRSMNGSRWTMLQQLCDELNIQRPVSLRVVDDALIPSTTGIIHPVILLPRVSESWSADRVRMVFQHELGHIARYDLTFSTMAQGVLALCWWNPLAWMAMAAMEREREQACDDVVIAGGVAPTHYAEELLNIVRELRPPTHPGFAVLGMARTSQVEQRLTAVLNPAVSRRGARRIFAAAASAVVILLLPAGRVVPIARAATTPTTAVTTAPDSTTLTIQVTSSSASASAAPATRGAPASALSANAIAQAREGATEPMISAVASVLRAVTAASPLNNGEPMPQAPSAPSPPLPPFTDSLKTGVQFAEIDEYAIGGACRRMTDKTSTGRSQDEVSDTYYHYDQTGCVRAIRRGDVQFDAMDIPVMLTGPRAEFIVERHDFTRISRATVRATANGVSIEYQRDGRVVSAEAAASWAIPLYASIARELALDAERRVDRIVRDGGAAALLREISLIRWEDAKAVYYEQGLASRRLDSPERALLRTSAQRFADTLRNNDTQTRLRTALANSTP